MADDLNFCYRAAPNAQTGKESCSMIPHSASSPVSLSYVTALRGFVPRQPGAAFTYAVIGCRNPALLTCLAASNPEGTFYGVIEDAAIFAQAKAQGAENVSFFLGGIVDLRHGRIPLPLLDYLCVDESEKPLDPVARATLFDIAKEKLVAGGLFNYAYRAYSDDAGALRFLVREFAPEMSADQADGFLNEIKTLGQTYLSRHPETAKALDEAIARKMPDMFFDHYDHGEARSGSFDTIVALRPRGFAYAGDSRIADNYLDFAVTPEAQKIVFACRDNFLYEPIKDFTLDRTIRSDIWCRGPATKSANAAELFGGFTYGIVTPQEEIPATIKTLGPEIDLSSALFTKLIGLMSLMPVSIGDFLSHPGGKDFAPSDVLTAIQVLVACGIAQPMRGLHKIGNITNVAQPRFSGAFNRSAGQAELSGSEIWLASPVMGNAVSVSPREALVMRALDRAGLANSVSALLPELEKLSNNPALTGAITDLAAPTAAGARTMIEDTVSRSIVQWYAYGLLEAA